MYDLPDVLMALVTGSAPYPRLHDWMIFFHPGKAPEPVGERQVAAHENAKVAYFCPEGGWEAGQACLPSAAKLMCIFDLERRFRVENNGIYCIMAHDLIRILRANSIHLIVNKLADLGFVVRFGGFGYHRHLLIYINC